MLKFASSERKDPPPSLEPKKIPSKSESPQIKIQKKGPVKRESPFIKQQKPKLSFEPSFKRTDEQTKILSKAQEAAQQRSRPHHKAALDNIQKMLTKDETSNPDLGSVARALSKVENFIRDSLPTRNFNANDLDRFERFKDSKGDKFWDKPSTIGDLKYKIKRGMVEREHLRYSSAFPTTPETVHGRPTYFAVNLGNHPLGGAEYYGHSYLVAKEEVYRKATLTPGDTFNEEFAKKGHLATIDNLDGIIAEMDTQQLQKLYKMATGESAVSPMENNLYIEAQIQNLNWNDIQKVVLDRNEVPLGSHLENEWVKLSERENFKLEFGNYNTYRELALENGAKIANQQYSTIPLESEGDSERPLPNPTKINYTTFMEAFGLTFDSSKMGNINQEGLKKMGLLLSPKKPFKNDTMFSKALEKIQKIAHRHGIEPKLRVCDLSSIITRTY